MNCWDEVGAGKLTTQCYIYMYMHVWIINCCPVHVSNPSQQRHRKHHSDYTLIEFMLTYNVNHPNDSSGKINLCRNILDHYVDLSVLYYWTCPCTCVCNTGIHVNCNVYMYVQFEYCTWVSTCFWGLVPWRPGCGPGSPSAGCWRWGVPPLS